MLPAAQAPPCPNSGLRGAGLPSAAPPPEGCLARTSREEATRGLFLCSLDCGAAAGASSKRVEAKFSLGPISGGEKELEPGGPAPMDPTWHTCATPVVAFEWAQPRGAGSSGDGWKLQFPHPGQGGSRSSGWRTFSSQYGKGEREHRLGAWGPLARKHTARARGEGPWV